MEKQLQTPWIRLAAKQFNHRADAPTLALHGWLDNAASFEPLARYLPNLNLLALDLPGHGHSDHRPPGQHYHFVDFIPDVIAAADCMGWEQFHLIGHSMGAGIATLLAASFPHRINKLVLIEGLGPWGDNPEAAPTHLAQATKQILNPQPPAAPRYATLHQLIAARIKAGDLSEPNARLLMTRNSIESAQGVDLSTDPRLRYRSPIYITEQQAQAYLRHIEAPCLFIRDKDRTVPEEYNWDERETLINRLTVKRIGGGHHLHMENPQAVAQIIQEFFDS